MRRKIRSKLVLITSVAAILVLACSTREDFVVVNKSDGVIRVQYQLKRYNPESPNSITINPPAKLRVDELSYWGNDWRNLTTGQYHFDYRNGAFTVDVAPNEALLVGFAYNYRGHHRESSEFQFDLKRIEITGSRGSIALEDRQAQIRFENIQGTYILTYE
jgi:hypothetical protein